MCSIYIPVLDYETCITHILQVMNYMYNTLQTPHMYYIYVTHIICMWHICKYIVKALRKRIKICEYFGNEHGVEYNHINTMWIMFSRMTLLHNRSDQEVVL